ncbi:hypothetical protein, partial [Halarchaeum acidiphilum]
AAASDAVARAFEVHAPSDMRQTLVEAASDAGVVCTGGDELFVAGTVSDLQTFADRITSASKALAGIAGEIRTSVE